MGPYRKSGSGHARHGAVCMCPDPDPRACACAGGTGISMQGGGALEEALAASPRLEFMSSQFSGAKPPRVRLIDAAWRMI